MIKAIREVLSEKLVEALQSEKLVWARQLVRPPVLAPARLQVELLCKVLVVALPGSLREPEHQ